VPVGTGIALALFLWIPSTGDKMSDATGMTYVILETGPDGRSRFREEKVSLREVKPMLFLSTPMPGGNVMLRESPPGYSMDFHPTVSPQWTFMLSGALEIGLTDGTKRVFRAGDVLYATDTTPPGLTFDPKVHGHDSRTVGDEPVVAVLVRA
jgi:quercetin dioxygenase-like cupin family protein